LCQDRPLWKESLNSDGQQLHQYQQDEQSPLNSDGQQFHQYQQNKQQIIEHKKEQHMMMEIHNRKTCSKMTFFIVNDRPLSSTIKG
jgi:hypothetical protein